MEVLTFGRKKHLMGILHRAPANSVGIVMWNTGISSRTGSFRSNVETAEALVKLGYTVFRFDLSKLGDSVDAGENLSWQDRNSLDLRDALDAVNALTGITEYVLVGLCSGALDSYYFALNDTRVRGAFMIDSLVFPTLRHRLTFFAMRLASPYRWSRLFKKILGKFINVPRELLPEDQFESNYPTAIEAAKGFGILIDRGIPLHLIYTGGFTPFYSYRTQFFAMLPGLNSKGRVQVEYWPDVDHLFMLREDRQRFIAKLSTWLETNYPVRPLLTAPVYGHPLLTLAAAEGIANDPEILPLPAPIALPTEGKAKDPTPEVETENLRQVLSVLNKILAPTVLDADDNFFEFGGTSILAVKAAAELSQVLKVDVPVVAFYTYLQPRRIAKAIDEGTFTSGPSERDVIGSATRVDDAIAIIGMACKVPGAQNVSEFWDMILNGGEGLTHWTPEELDGSLPASLTRSPNYVASRGVIEGDRFDAPFFKMSKREAGLLDPQQRILLETCWQALEDSGYLDQRSTHKIAVYAGVGSNTYLTRNLAQGHFEPHSEEEYLALILNDKDYVATRIAFAMNLKGPAISVHTACSTSLVAVIEAIKALQSGQADIAIAGAAAVNAPMASGHLYQEGGIFSRDGHCRPFDAEASGTVFSDGSAVVVLKPLLKAIADQDQIYAVIKGWGLNNDGSDKSSFAGPSVMGQAEAIGQALAVGAIDPSTVGYIECHGTGTPIGDPIELEGLKRAYGMLRAGFCAIGSSKANIGHLTAAAGTISLIKAALAIQHAIKPALTHFTKAHPNIRLDQLPFSFPKQNLEWKGLRRAGVSSFGVGGTNAHVVLEEAPEREITRPAPTLDPFVTLRWSTMTQASSLLLATQLRLPKNLVDLSYTLAMKRPIYPWVQAVTGFGSLDFKLAAPPRMLAAKTKLVFCFPGQGSQYPRMGLDLSASWPRFAQHYKNALQHFKNEFALDLMDSLTNESLLNQTQYTQANLFVLEWSLAQALQECGFEAHAVLGHSLGEITAATIAGVFRFEDAAYLVFHRARLMQQSAPGLMLAVRTSLDKLLPLLPAHCDLAAENSVESLVASGSAATIIALESILSKHDIAHKRLNTAHAFHSSGMEGVLGEFAAYLEKITLHAPKISLYSTVTGKCLTSAEACSRAYWVQQIRVGVLFHKAVMAATEIDNPCFVEIGPGDTLFKFIQQSSRSLALSALANRGLTETQDIGRFFSELSYQDHGPFIAKNGHIVSAAPYPFYGERYWLEPKSLKKPAKQAARPASKRPAPKIEETNMNHSRVQKLLGLLIDQNPDELDKNAAWTELGMDSLLLTQWALKLQREFAYDINLRRLQTDVPNLKTLLATFEKAGSDELENQYFNDTGAYREEDLSFDSSFDPEGAMQAGNIHGLMRDQIKIMNRQLDIMQRLMGATFRPDGELRKVEEIPLASSPLIPKPKKRLFEFVNDLGPQRLEGPEGAFIGLNDKGQPALFIEDASGPDRFLEIS